MDVDKGLFSSVGRACAPQAYGHGFDPHRRLCCETHAKATKWEGRKVDAFGAGTSKENENAWEVWFAGWSRRLGGPVAQWIRHRPAEPGIVGLNPTGVI